MSATKRLEFGDYEALWRWSVQDQEAFWATMWEYFGVMPRRPYTSVMSRDAMPLTRWFEGSELNYVDHVFRHREQPGPAIIYSSESSGRGELSWPELERQVGALARTLRRLGVVAGDRVAGYLPNIPQAVVAFLAAASIGAIWSVCAPDMGPVGVLDRFRQISPKVLIACDGYRFAGKPHDRRETLDSIVQELPTLQGLVWVDHLVKGAPIPSSVRGLATASWTDATMGEGRADVAALPANHPLWILYSSGTTGLPKAIVHGHVGMLLNGLLGVTIHNDVGHGDRVFWNSSTSWMVWNFHVACLLAGATIVLVDGAVTGPVGDRPDLLHLWRLAEQEQVNVFGAGAAFYHACLKAGVEPRQLGLTRLKTVCSTGSPLSTDGYRWLMDAVKRDLWINSISGGTDICGAFVGGVPALPVYAGELQARALGAAVEAYSDSGQPLLGEVGELVCTRPLPSMPLFFWGDTDHQRYRESYFDTFTRPDGSPVWRHGDWIKLVPRQEAVGAVIYGRSDATINRQGIRMGTAELYRAVEAFEEIVDSLVVDLEYLGRESYMALFVVLRSGGQLTPDLDARLRSSIRTALSPRHVPNEILAVPEVPRTLTGKKLELPIKKLLLGHPIDKVVNRESLANPGSLDWYVQFALARGSARPV